MRGSAKSGFTPGINRFDRMLVLKNNPFVAKKLGRPVTLKDIAQATGLSVPAVSLSLFDNPKANVRYHAAYAFGMVEGKVAKLGVPGLTKLLKDPDERVKGRAIASLGSLAGESKVALPALRELMQDANPRIQRRAQDAVRLIEAKGK